MQSVVNFLQTPPTLIHQHYLLSASPSVSFANTCLPSLSHAPSSRGPVPPPAFPLVSNAKFMLTRWFQWVEKSIPPGPDAPGRKSALWLTVKAWRGEWGGTFKARKGGRRHRIGPSTLYYSLIYGLILIAISSVEKADLRITLPFRLLLKMHFFISLLFRPQLHSLSW